MVQYSVGIWAHKMLGYAPNEIIGENISKIISKKYIEVVIEDSKSYLEAR